jgi:DNA polymerase-3 subunit gamma/tau
VVNTAADKPVDLETLKKVWAEFAELRRNQVAEYQLLKRDFTYEDNKIVVTLNNAIEEPFLQNMRTSLIAYLRDKLSNHSIMVTGVLREIENNRPMIYTNQERFSYLLEKNPILKELKERFGLDPD